MVSRCFPGGYNVKLYISRGRLAWWLLAFLCCVEWSSNLAVTVQRAIHSNCTEQFSLNLSVNSYSASRDNWCTATLWNRIMTAQCEGMGEVGSARYEPALLRPCPSIRVLSYSNCQRDPCTPADRPGSVSVKVSCHNLFADEPDYLLIKICSSVNQGFIILCLLLLLFTIAITINSFI